MILFPLLLIAATAAQDVPPPSCRQSSFAPRNKDRRTIGEEYKSAVFAIQLEDELKGTGFLIDASGYALTAAHVVIEDGKPVSGLNAFLQSGQVVKFDVVKSLLGEGIDAALLRLESSKLRGIRPIDVGLSAPPLESTVYTIGRGRPGGARVQDGTLQQVLPLYVESKSVRREIGAKFIAKLEAVPGDSGSPLLNEQGAAVGLYMEGDAVQATAEVIPASLLEPLLRLVPETPRVSELDARLRKNELAYSELIEELRPTTSGCTNMELYGWAARILNDKPVYENSAAMIRCPFYRALAHRGLEDVAARFGGFMTSAPEDERKEHAQLVYRVFDNSTRLRNNATREALALAAWEELKLSNEPFELAAFKEPHARRYYAYSFGAVARNVKFEDWKTETWNLEPKMAVARLESGLKDDDMWVRQESANSLVAVTKSWIVSGTLHPSGSREIERLLMAANLQPAVKEAALHQIRASRPPISADPLFGPFSILGSVLSITAVGVMGYRFLPDATERIISIFRSTPRR